MTTTSAPDLYYDPYDFEIDTNPYPIWKRMRDEAPLYYNEKYDFYALSRFDDVEKGLVDWQTYQSGRGTLLEIIRIDFEMPSGMFISEDPPLHDIHRGLMSRVFTPKKMSAIEPKARDFCARTLDPLVGTGRFDFVRDLGAQMPMKVIGMLLGIPESDQAHVVEHGDSTLRTERGGKMTENPDGVIATGEVFASYIDWRAEHPSDDIMTELLTAEFAAETGATRSLSRDELLLYLQVIATAGSETTTRLIGWAGKVLAEHPDQRRELVANRTLLPAAIEELLRFEPPAPHVSRYVTRDMEYYGQTVPAGNALMMIVGAANRDPRRFGDDSEQFNIHREPHQHVAFGVGTHFCLGNALARLEGRIALDEILDRFPEWEVDLSSAALSPTSTVRGWESMPAVLP